MTSKSRNIMYTERCDHLPQGGIPALKQRVKAICGDEDLCAIKVEKDTCEDAFHRLLPKTPAPHVHVGFSFKNARSLNSITKLLNTSPHNITKWDSRVANMWAYLLNHLTTGALSKTHTTKIKDVYANFDIEAVVLRNQSIINKTLSQDERTIQAYSSKLITYDELIAKLNPLSVLKNHRKIAKIRFLLSKQRHDTYLNEMHGKSIQTLLFDGFYADKIKLARTYAELLGCDGFRVLTSQNGFLSTYEGEEAVVVELPSPDYFDYARNRPMTDLFLNEIIQHPEILDRDSKFHNRQIFLNFKLVIFIVTPHWDQWGDKIFATFNANDANLETDADYAEFIKQIQSNKKADPSKQQGQPNNN